MLILQIPAPRIYLTVGGFAGAAALLFYLLIGWKLARRRLEKLGHRVPLVASKLPFGVDLFVKATNQHYKNEFFNWSRELLDVPGRTVGLSMLGAEILMTDDTDNIRAILSTRFSDWGKGDAFRKIWYDLMLDSIFVSDGPLWHTNKDLLRDHTAKSRSTDYEITEIHVSKLIRKLSNRDPHDCMDLLDRYMLDVVSDVFLGKCADALSTESQPLRHAVEEMYVWNSTKLLIGKLGGLLPGNSKACAVVDDYLEHVIEHALSVLEEPDSENSRRKEQTFLCSLLAQGLSRKRVKDQIMAILVGGKDPAVITLGWAFYELARTPQVVAQLRAEIASNVGFSTLPTVAQLRKMTLLQNVIKEALRLHSPLGFNIRTALNDTTLPTGGGPTGKDRVGVLKGTHIILSYMGAQRRHDIMGPTADTFDPSRWTHWTPKLYEFLPFNHGPRICLGRNFAWMQMEYVLCRIFQAFQGVELVGREADEEMKIKIALNTKPAEPVVLRFIK